MAPFAHDLGAVLARAFDQTGLLSLITVASDVASNARAVALAEAHEHVYATVGLHPHDASHMTDSFLAEIGRMAAGPKVVAIGETGLDYHYDHSPRDVQRRVFGQQLDLAKRLGLPAVIHSREADEDTVAILRASGLTRGVLHCFSGSPALFDLAVKMGLHMSIAGPVTFPRAADLRAAAARIPDDLLLVETDAPYLTPVPYRGKRNEPAYVAYTAAEVAALRGITLEDVARITTLNARRLFGVGPEPPHGRTYTYKIRQSLYLNVTNRCSNNCGFCVRSRSDFVKGHNLRLDREPTADEVKAEIGDPAAYAEIVFCGYGEPMIRLDLMKDVAAWVKARGGRVRVNTNGQAALIHGRDVLPELKGLVDTYSVSLDAEDEETYNRLCSPDLPGAYGAVLEFIRMAARTDAEVVATVVDAGDADVDACRALAEGLGARLRVRHLDVVG
jgi:TatD DNase family protein